ncbi:GNAT family N-acetyltransferase [Marinilabiliaceae bacterium ANBcel2]|nr:GNAT family N-acetyltransferase [Marinilabiliaceae bacterium ANBcel2]
MARGGKRKRSNIQNNKKITVKEVSFPEWTTTLEKYNHSLFFVYEQQISKNSDHIEVLFLKFIYNSKIVAKLSAIIISKPFKNRQLYSHGAPALKEFSRAQYLQCLYALYNYCKQSKINRIEIKGFDNIYSYIIKSPPFFKTQIDEYYVDLTSFDLKRSCNRNFLRKLKKNEKKSYRIITDTSGKYIDNLIELLETTHQYRKEKYQTNYNPFYTVGLNSNNLKEFKDHPNLKYYILTNKKKIECIQLNIEYNKRAYGLLLGSSVESYNIGSRAILDHYIIDSLKTRNYIYYNMGSVPVGSDGSGLSQYKQSVGAKLKSSYGVYTHFIQPPYTLLNHLYYMVRLALSLVKKSKSYHKLIKNVSQHSSAQSWNNSLSQFNYSIFISYDWLLSVADKNNRPLFLNIYKNGIIVGKIGGLLSGRNLLNQKVFYAYASPALKEERLENLNYCMNALYDYARNNKINRIIIGSYDQQNNLSCTLPKFFITKRTEYIIKKCGKGVNRKKGFIKNIKKAQKHDASISSSKSLKYLETLYKLLDSTRHVRNKKYKSDYTPFFMPKMSSTTIENILKSDIAFFLTAKTKLSQSPDSIQLNIKKEKRVYALLMGATPNAYKTGLSSFIDNKIIEKVESGELKYYNTGGVPTSKSGDGLAKYKRLMGGEPLNAYGATTNFILFPLKLFNPLLNLLRKLPQNRIVNWIKKRSWASNI